MNKTFKVIFSRVRSSYVVANEITRSAKKKGAKALLIVAALTLSSTSYAVNFGDLFGEIFTSAGYGIGSSVGPVVDEEDDASSGLSEVTQETKLSVNQEWSSSTVPSSITNWSLNDSTKTEFRGIDMKEGATGKAENISVNFKAEGNLGAKVYGIYNEASTGTQESASFSGSTLSVVVDSAFKGDVAAAKLSKNTFITAETTTLSAKSKTHEVYGLQVAGADTTVEITGNTKISAEITERSGTSSTDVNGVHQEGKNTLTIGSEGKTVEISAISAEPHKAEEAAFIKNHATFTVKGSQITFKSTGIGLYAVDSSVVTLGDTATESISFDAESAAIRLGENVDGERDASATLTANAVQISTKGKGIAFGVVSGHKGDATVTVNAKTITVNTEETAFDATATGSKLNLTATDSLTVTTEAGAGLAMDDTDSVANIVAKTISITAKQDAALDVSKGSVTLKAEDGTITLTSSNAEEKKNVSKFADQNKKDEQTTVLVKDSATVSLEAANLVIKHVDVLPKATTTSEEDTSSATEGREQPWDKTTTETTPVVSKSSGIAIGSYTGANLTINAATEIDTPVAIQVGGNSTTTINKDASHTTKIAGNIVFTSNANLDVTLSGSASSWTGRAYQSYETTDTTTESVSVKPISEAATAVTGFALKVVNSAKWVLAEGKSFVNKLTLANGGSIDATNATVFNAGTYNAKTEKVEAGITVEGKENTLTLGDKTVFTGTIEMADGSELITPLTTAFSVTKVSEVVTDAVSRLAVTLKEGAKSAALTINDVFTLTTDAFTKMNAQFSGVTLNLAHMTLAQSTSEGDSGTTQFTSDVALKTLTGNGDFTVAAGKNLTLSGSDTTSEINTLSLASETGASSTLTLTNGTNANVNEIAGSGSGAVVVGDSSSLAVGTINNVEAVTLGSGSILTLGSSEKSTESSVGTISTAEGATLKTGNEAKVNVEAIDGNGTIEIREKSEVNVTKLSGASTITVGDTEGEGATLSVSKLEMSGGSLFLDPYYGHTSARFESFGSEGLDTNISVGSGAFVVLGSTTVEAAKAKVASISEVANAETTLYIATPVKVAFAGSIIVDSALTTADTSNAGKVIFRSDATLVIDQSAVDNAEVFESASEISVNGTLNVGIVNAAQGHIEFGQSVTLGTDGKVAFYTDSPFLSASLDATTGSVTVAKTVSDDALSTIASMGVQTMIRNADAVLAETIADRAAALENGNGLWVSVRGERFKQTSLGNGAGFTANVGYGAFGAEFAPTAKTNLGVAFQYGHGSVKGKVHSVKNKTKDYGVALYGSALLGETGIKLLGEVAYTKSTNDVTNSYDTRFNQKLDAKMLSAAVTAQKTFDVGSVNVTPSVGIRVSRIKTDAMNAGSVSIDKQKQTLVQVPVAVRVAAKAIETTSGWSITPHAKFAYVPTFGDKEIDIFGVKKTVIDTSPVQGAFGVGVKKGNFAIDATAHVGAGKKGTSVVGAKLGLTYRF